MIEFYSVAVAAGADNGVSEGVFFPVGFISNLEAGEIFGAANDDTKESKITFALLSMLLSQDLIGLTVTNGNPIANGIANSFNQVITAVIQYVGDLSNGTFEVLKAPSTGSEASKIKALQDISANIVKVEAEGEITGEGFLIPSADSVKYGAPAHSTLNISAGQDNRDYLASIIEYLIDTLIVRAAGTKVSALTAKAIGTPTTFVFDANALDADNPTTGYSSLTGLKPVQLTHTFTLQYILNPVSQKYEVRLA